MNMYCLVPCEERLEDVMAADADAALVVRVRARVLAPRSLVPLVRLALNRFGGSTLTLLLGMNCCFDWFEYSLASTFSSLTKNIDMLLVSSVLLLSIYATLRQYLRGTKRS